MARIPGSDTHVELLVNCKTYPAVSTRYTETVCTGGVQVDGQFVRLYPIPFRFLDADEQYKRWDLIRVRAYRDTKDTRPESWHLEGGTAIERIQHVSSEKQRWDWMQKTVQESAAAMEARGITNGLVEIKPLEFYWEPDEKEWTPGQLSVIQQGDLFASKAQMKELAERVPWQFRLKYRELSTGREDDGKVLAWSYYQGYRRAFVETKDSQVALERVAAKVKASIFSPDRVVFAILGTHSRFGHWMISALYHVPKEIVEADRRQGCRLF